MKVSITIDGLSTSEAHDLLGTARHIEQADAGLTKPSLLELCTKASGAKEAIANEVKRQTATSAEPPLEETPDETVDDTPAPRRRRRPPVDTGGEGSPTEADEGSEGGASAGDGGGTVLRDSSEQPVKTRRKRATKAEMAERRATAADKEQAPQSGTSEAGDGAVVGDSGDDRLTDADMSKAASEGARVIGPEAVTAILSEFGVGSVNKLPQAQRQEFVDNVDVAKAEAGVPA